MSAHDGEAQSTVVGTLSVTVQSEALLCVLASPINLGDAVAVRVAYDA